MVAYKYVIMFFQMEPKSAVKVCSECGNSYKSKSGYSVHMRKHRREPMYKCCDKEFYSTPSFKRHRYFTLAIQLLKQHLLIRLWFWDNGN